MSGTVDTDVLVVGAGPAGCAAATTLARRGLGVVLVDRARFPRDKCCGDGLTTGALRRLELLGLDPGDVASFTSVRALAVRSPHGRIVELPLERGGTSCAAVARRRDLDAALVAVARAAGAVVIEGHELERLAVGRAGRDPACCAGFGDGLLVRSHIVVAADGAWSRVRALREHANSRPSRPGVGGWHAFRAYAAPVARGASEKLWVAFEPELLPGYLWSFPLAGGTANIGIVVRRGDSGSGRALAAAWRDALAGPFLTSLLGPAAALEAPARSWPIPAGVDGAPLAEPSGRVVYVGDAARAADPFTGEGIAQALETGAAAARAIADAGTGEPELAARRYAAEVRRTLGTEHRMGRALSGLVGSAGGAEGVVRVAGASRWTRRAAGRWLFEDVPRTLPVTPSSWRRETFERPVPYSGAPGALGAREADPARRSGEDRGGLSRG